MRHRSLAYVDVEHAYWQLLSVFCPDDLILCGELVRGGAEWLTRAEVDADRRLRHAVVGSVFANHISFYRYGELVTVPKASKWSNPTLKLFCMQTLHAICGRLRRDVDVHAWLTDAAIVDATDVLAVQRFVSREWLLSTAVKGLGSGAVFNATTYAVGEKRSLNLVHGTATPRTLELRAYSNLRRVPAVQLATMRKRVAA